MKIIMLVALLALVLLSACDGEAVQHEGSHYAPVPNEKFTAWFRPTPEELAQLGGGVRDVDIFSSYEHETIYLRQIIGNLQGLYLALDVSEGAQINRAEIFPTDCQAPWRASTSTGNVMLHQLPGKSGYLVRYFPDPPLYEGQEIVMRLETDNTTHEISFVPNVSAPVRTAPIFHESAEQVGQITVSAIHMHIEFADIDGELADTFPPITVELKNGETVRPVASLSRVQPRNLDVRGAGIFLGETYPRQFFSWLERRNLWILDDITAVEFGETMVNWD